MISEVALPRTCSVIVGALLMPGQDVVVSCPRHLVTFTYACADTVRRIRRQ